jgi:hypothetical protein
MKQKYEKELIKISTYETYVNILVDNFYGSTVLSEQILQ